MINIIFYIPYMTYTVRKFYFWRYCLALWDEILIHLPLFDKPLRHIELCNSVFSQIQRNPPTLCLTVPRHKWKHIYEKHRFIWRSRDQLCHNKFIMQVTSPCFWYISCTWLTVRDCIRKPYISNAYFMRADEYLMTFIYPKPVSPWKTTYWP